MSGVDTKFLVADRLISKKRGATRLTWTSTVSRRSRSQNFYLTVVGSLGNCSSWIKLF